MKKLLIMRHAKSDNYFDMPDFERPLNERGLLAATKMGEELKKMGTVPDLICSSSANRAKTTAILFAKSNGYTKEILFLDNLYESSEKEIIKQIIKISDDVQNLLIIGHNPTLEDIVFNLSETKTFFSLSTASIAIMTSKIDKWADIKGGIFKLKKTLKPNDLE